MSVISGYVNHDTMIHIIPGVYYWLIYHTCVDTCVGTFVDI